VIQESTSFKTELDVTPGHTSLLPFLVQNPYSHDEVFRIEIQDPDNFTAKPEMSLVHNQKNEWFFWFNEGKCQKPPSWEMVGST
jgi:hypothetical protein